MTHPTELNVRREALLREMLSIRSMKRGTLSIRPEKRTGKGNKPVTHGPYPLFVRREGNRTVGHRLCSPEEVAQTRADIAAYEHFMALCKEFAELTERLGERERQQAVQQTASDEAVKKGPTSRSSSRRKLRG